MSRLIASPLARSLGNRDKSSCTGYYRAVARAVLTLLMVAHFLVASAAKADGVYGRFAGEFTGAAGLGGGVLFGDSDAEGALTAELRMRFLDAAGPFVAGTWVPGGAGQWIVGAELRPLFPALVFAGFASGSEWFDLWIQSLSVELGVSLAEQQGSFGAALLVGLGIEVPLVLPSQWANGVFLRLQGRHRSSSSRAVAGVPGGVDEWFAGGVLVVRWSMSTGWVTREPSRYNRR